MYVIGSVWIHYIPLLCLVRCTFTRWKLQVCGDVESPEGAEEVEMATSGATLTMLDKAVLGGVSMEMKYKYIIRVKCRNQIVVNNLMAEKMSNPSD